MYMDTHMVASSTFTNFGGFRGTPGTPPGSAPELQRMDDQSNLVLFR